MIPFLFYSSLFPHSVLFDRCLSVCRAVCCSVRLYSVPLFMVNNAVLFRFRSVVLHCSFPFCHIPRCFASFDSIRRYPSIPFYLNPFVFILLRFFFFFLSVQFYPVKLDPSRQFRLVRSFQFCPAFSSSAVLLFLFRRYSLPPCSALPPLYSTPSCSVRVGADPSCRSTRFYFVLRSVLFPVQIHGILFSAFLL